MRIAAVVILYNPGKEIIYNIQSYLNDVEKLFVLDNTENPEEELINKITSLPKTTYFNDGENKGIAVRLNQAAALAIAGGFDLLLTMDQDSYFDKANLVNYLNSILVFKTLNEVGMFGIEYDKKKKQEVNCEYTDLSILITSGSIINLEVFKKIGQFDEALFIDLVDIEYCFRAIINGYKIIQFKNIFLEHSLGETSVHKSIKNFKNSIRNLHSPVRVYYMTRNYFYIKSKYRKVFNTEILAIKKDLLIRIKNNLLYNEKRLSVLKYLLKGVIDFNRKKMGKFNSLNLGVIINLV